jgi:hypothetical protein
MSNAEITNLSKLISARARVIKQEIKCQHSDADGTL